MSCPSTRAGKPALTFPFFSIDSDPVRVQSRRFLHRRDRALHRSKQRCESVTRLRAWLPFQRRAELYPTRGFVNLRGMLSAVEQGVSKRAARLGTNQLLLPSSAFVS